MKDFGFVEPGETLYIEFDTFGADGQSLTMSGLATTDIEIYRDGSETQRASDSGYTLLATDGTDIDGLTGIQGISVSLADNGDAGFYRAGSHYRVVISSVTINAQTVSFTAATFRIGYRAAVLNTTIATLSSQTSFTLTSGPAEDDALNGTWAVIHDVASAVQKAVVQILDYTGASKTVTLAAGATFTVAATDNISIMGPMPLQPTTAGRTLDVSTTGEAGLDFDNLKAATGATTLTNITVPTVTNLTNLPAITANWLTAAGTAADFGTEIGTAVWASAARTLTSLAGLTVDTVTTVTNQLTAAQIATGVWQDATAGDFTVASSIGKALYINNVAPGGSGGLLISGSNAGTTTFGALTVAGATTLTGNVSLGGTLTVAGATTLAALSMTTLTASGAVALQSTLIVSGATTFTGAVTATNASNSITGVGVTSNVKKNQALASFTFLMTDSTNHAPATGLTVTCTRSIDGAAFAAGTLANVAEVANGIYKVDFGAGDLNGNVIILKATAAASDTTYERIVTQP